MCLLALAWRCDPRSPLVLIGNRDERYERPSSAAARWDEAPQVLGGRDLEYGGTWLGVSEAGRLAAVTNVRVLQPPDEDRASRGLLTARFLAGEIDLAGLQALEPDAFRPFNLIAIEGWDALVLSNQPPLRRSLEPGLHGLSNGAPDAPWPKVRRAEAALSDWLAGEGDDPEPLFRVLADETPAPDKDLPDTGVGLERERQLSPCFLRGEVYGTRCSTVIRIDASGQGIVVERRFGPGGAPAGETRLPFQWPV